MVLGVYGCWDIGQRPYFARSGCIDTCHIMPVAPANFMAVYLTVLARVFIAFDVMFTLGDFGDNRN